MTEQTNAQQPIDNNILRLIIREAVEREVATNLAPLRTQQQVQDGMLKQFNRDVLLVQAQCGDLDELVRGNPKQNLVGLAEQIRTQNGILNTLQNQFTTAVDAVKRELRADIQEIKNKQDEATKMREALINQWRGAKWAIIALGIITGLPYLDTIGKFLHLVP